MGLSVLRFQFILGATTQPRKERSRTLEDCYTVMGGDLFGARFACRDCVRCFVFPRHACFTDSFRQRHEKRDKRLRMIQVLLAQC